MQTQSPIDFSRFPEISSKLSTGELESINNIFNDIEVSQKIAESIESNKKRNLYGRIMGAVIIVLILTILSSITWVSQWLNQSVLSDNTFTLGLFIWLIILVIILYKLSQEKEVSYMSSVFPRICSLINTRLKSTERSPDFPDFDYLMQEKLLSGYDRNEFCGHSIYMDSEHYRIDGVEIKNSSQWRKRGRRLTDDCYILRATFRTGIQLSNPVLITHDVVDQRWLGSVSGLSEMSKFMFPWPISILADRITVLMENSLNKNRVRINQISWFEQAFDLYDRSPDQSDSKLILQDGLWEKLVGFVNQSKYKYAFLFTGNQLYIKQQLDPHHTDTWRSNKGTTGIKTFAKIEDFGTFYIQMRDALQLIDECHRSVCGRNIAQV